jgi:hypothetical protein
MSKLYRFVLFWLARLAGITGLIAGGKSLGKYLVARFKDPYFDSFSYNDLVFSGGVIFLLSLLVLIFVEVGISLGRNAVSGPVAAPTEGKPPRKTSPTVPVAAPPAPEQEEAVESPDARLARLVKPKED